MACALRRARRSPCLHRRLLDYAQRGGTVIVQYNKYSSTSRSSVRIAQASGNRVSDEPCGDDPGAGPSGVHYRTRSARRRWPKHGRRSAGLYFSGRRIRGTWTSCRCRLVSDNPGEKLGSLWRRRREGPVAVSRARPVATTPGRPEAPYQLLANLLACRKRHRRNYESRLGIWNSCPFQIPNSFILIQ